MLLAVCALAAACGGAAEAPAPLRFAVIPKALDIPVFTYARIGAERKAAELGGVEVIWRGPQNVDAEAQQAILEAFIAERVDGIAISCANGDVLAPTIDKAIEAGIPVVTWDGDAPTSRRYAYYGVDDFAAGQRLAQAAVEALGGRGTVAILTSRGAYNLQRRLDGVREVLEAQPGMRVVETFDVREDIVFTQEIIRSGTERYPDLSAWISVGGWPIMTRSALTPVDPARTLVFSFDTIPPAPELLQAGKVHTLVGQKYFGWGSEAVRLLHDIASGRMPDRAIIDSGLDVVTRENVDEFLATWHALENGT